MKKIKISTSLACLATFLIVPCAIDAKRGDPARQLPLKRASRTTEQTRGCSPCVVCPCARDYGNCYCRTMKYYPKRSVGWDRMRWLVGSVGHEHQHDIDPSYAVLNATLAYNASFRPEQVTGSLFGADMVRVVPDGSNFLQACNQEHARNVVVQGSDYQDENRNPNAWLADYFYLPPSYQGYITLAPRTFSWLVPLELYLGIDSLFTGFYMRLYGTVTHSHWRANFSETLVDTDLETNGYQAGYFSTAEIPSNNLLETFESYISGSCPDIGSLQDDIDKTIIFQPLQYARISRSARAKTGFADLALDIGLNYLRERHYNLGFYLRGVAPTSPKRNPTYLFEPFIGNDGHWEAGGGINASYVFWHTEDGESHLGFYLDTMVSYVFPTKEQRTFDLILRPNSAYMLAAKFDTNGEVPNPATGSNFLAVGTTSSADTNTVSNPGHQFALEYAPVANLTTIYSNVNTDVVIDAAMMFNLSSYGWSFDLGYNFWIRLGEHMANPGSNSVDLLNSQALTNSTQSNKWALKGDSRMFGYIQADPPEDYAIGDPVPLSATQGIETIDNLGASTRNGLNKVVLNGSTLYGSTDINRNVNDANNAYGMANPSESVSPPTIPLYSGPGTPPTGYQIKSSRPMKFLTADDIDFVTTKSSSHKFFGHIHHTRDGDNVTVHAGVGGFAEFGMNGSMTDYYSSSAQPTTDTTTQIGDKIKVALTQWSLWFKCGITFNGFAPTNSETLTPNRNVDEALQRAGLE